MSRRRSRVAAKPRPRDTAPLPSRCLVILRSRLDASTARALGRDLAVSDATITRAVRGEGLTPSMRRLLELQLLAPASGENTHHGRADANAA